MTKKELTWLEYKHNVLNRFNPPDYTGSVTTFSHTEPISGFYYIAKSLEELSKKQEPLGGEFEKVLHDNLCDLYEK